MPDEPQLPPKGVGITPASVPDTQKSETIPIGEVKPAPSTIPPVVAPKETMKLTIPKPSVSGLSTFKKPAAPPPTAKPQQISADLPLPPVMPAASTPPPIPVATTPIPPAPKPAVAPQVPVFTPAPAAPPVTQIPVIPVQPKPATQPVPPKPAFKFTEPVVAASSTPPPSVAPFTPPAASVQPPIPAPALETLPPVAPQPLPVKPPVPLPIQQSQEPLPTRQSPPVPLPTQQQPPVPLPSTKTAAIPAIMAKKEEGVAPALPQSFENLKKSAPAKTSPVEEALGKKEEVKSAKKSENLDRASAPTDKSLTALAMLAALVGLISVFYLVGSYLNVIPAF